MKCVASVLRKQLQNLFLIESTIDLSHVLPQSLFCFLAITSLLGSGPLAHFHLLHHFRDVTWLIILH